VTRRLARLSAGQAHRLERICRRPWSSAVEAARNPEPSPAVRSAARLYRSPWRRSWQFPTEIAAERWNRDWEAVEEGRIEAHPAFLSQVLAQPQHPETALVAELSWNILLEEICGGTPYPGVRQGWSYVLVVTPIYRITPRVWSTDSFVIAVEGAVVDAYGEAWWTLEAAREYALEGAPTAALELLARTVHPPLVQICA